MAFRFFRRMKIAPGVTLNFSKSGISTSFGVRGAKVTVGPRGVRRTVGLPGTGLFYTETGSGAGGKRRSNFERLHVHRLPTAKTTADEGSRYCQSLLAEAARSHEGCESIRKVTPR